MAKRHFLSVLGASNYTEVKYICGDKSMVTCYVQEATLKLKMLEEGEYTEEDRVTIFVTEKAAADNWQDRDYTEQELQRMRVEKPVRKTGLYTVLRKAFGITEDASRLIPMGATEDELWEIFNTIYDEIGDGEELYVDITHSMRNLPILMLSVIAYARALKNVSVKGIYYGAFEAGTKNAEGMTEALVFDLVTFLDILDWSQAAASFVKYGNSDEIKALYEAQKDRNDLNLWKVVDELSAITQGLETSRGCFRETKAVMSGVSVLRSYRSYEKYYDLMEKRNRKTQGGQTGKRQIEPLRKLFDVINDKLQVFDVEDNFAFGLAAIDWAIDNNKTQQGFTALDETIKTWLCRRYGLDEFLEQHRDGICKMICNLFVVRMQKGVDFQTLFSEAGRAEVYREWEEVWESRGYGEKQRATSVTPEEEREAARRLAMELPPILPQISGEISNRRNSMNHFGYSNINRFSSRTLYADLKDYNEKFREVIAMVENGGEGADDGETAEEEGADPDFGDGSGAVRRGSLQEGEL